MRLHNLDNERYNTALTTEGIAYENTKLRSLSTLAEGSPLTKKRSAKKYFTTFQHCNLLVITHIAVGYDGGEVDFLVVDYFYLVILPSETTAHETG